MTTMITEVFDALKAAGAPEDKAQAAAAESLNPINEFRGELKLTRWMVTFNLAFTVLVMVKLFL